MSSRLGILLSSIVTSWLLGSSCTPTNYFVLTPPTGALLVGQLVDVALAVECYDQALGGGIRVGFDAARLELVGFAFTPGSELSGFDRFSCAGSVQAPCPAATPGEFLLALGTFDGFSGRKLVGTVTFRALQSGIANVTAAAAPGTLAGAFYSDSAAPLAVTPEAKSVVIVAP